MIMTSNSPAKAQRAGKRCKPGLGAESEWAYELHDERDLPK